MTRRIRHAQLISGWEPFTAEEIERNVASGAWPNTTTIAVLKRNVAYRRNQTVLIDRSGDLTWHGLNELVDRAARAFLAHGVDYGDFVVLQLPNTATHYVLYLALNRIGAIPVMCLPRHRKIEIAHQLRTHQAKAICTIGGDKTEHVRMVDELRPEMPDLRLLLCTDKTTAPGWMSVDDFIASGDLHKDKYDLDGYVLDPNDLCMDQLSGGTTGVSKGIPHTHNFHIGLWDHWGRGMGYTDESVFLCATPVGHQASCAFSGASFLRGGKIVLADSSDPEQTLRLIERHRVTHTLLFPVQINRMLSLPSRSNYDLSSLRVVIYGGQKISPELISRTAQEMNANVVHTFGMTEGPATFGRWDSSLDSQMYTVGKPIFIGPTWNLRLVDGDNKDVPEGEIGELVAKGAFTIKAYFRAPDANTKSFDDRGFFHTSDLMMRRPDGRYVVMGRKTEMVIRGGENVYPGPIESALTRHPEFRNAAVIGMPHVDLGETLCAFIESTPGKRVDIEMVRAFLKSEGLAVFQWPESVVQIQTWPWTSAGKIDKAVLRAFAVRGLLDAGRVTPSFAEDYLKRDRITSADIAAIVQRSNMKVVQAG
jgi:non-ribosomal peptide synthetase component E (peptide arylation enzyme)